MLRSATAKNRTSSFASLGSQIDHPIGRLDQIQVVFDNDDGVALVDQAMEDLEQQIDVMKV